MDGAGAWWQICVKVHKMLVAKVCSTSPPGHKRTEKVMPRGELGSGSGVLQSEHAHLQICLPKDSFTSHQRGRQVHSISLLWHNTLLGHAQDEKRGA